MDPKSGRHICITNYMKQIPSIIPTCRILTHDWFPYLALGQLEHITAELSRGQQQMVSQVSAALFQPYSVYDNKSLIPALKLKK